MLGNNPSTRRRPSLPTWQTHQVSSQKTGFEKRPHSGLRCSHSAKGRNRTCSLRGVARPDALQRAIIATNTRTDVFLSYANSDQDRAEEMVAVFEAAGLTCWYAPRDIAPGKQFPERIVNAMQGSSHFVTLLSKNAQQSRHVYRECYLWDELGRDPIPMMLEDCRLESRFAYLLAGTQRIAWPKRRALAEYVKSEVLGTNRLE